MNETKSNTNKSRRPGSLFVLVGIMFCTMGGMKLTRGLFDLYSADGRAHHSSDFVVGGTMLAAGIINVAAGFHQRRKAATKDAAEAE